MAVVPTGYGSILVCFGSTCAHSLAMLYSAAGAFMPTETGPHLELDRAHVLFVDVVGYSKLLIDEQRALLEELNHVNPEYR